MFKPTCVPAQKALTHDLIADINHPECGLPAAVYGIWPPLSPS